MGEASEEEVVDSSEFRLTCRVKKPPLCALPLARAMGIGVACGGELESVDNAPFELGDLSLEGDVRKLRPDGASASFQAGEIGWEKAVSVMTAIACHAVRPSRSFSAKSANSRKGQRSKSLAAI